MPDFKHPAFLLFLPEAPITIPVSDLCNGVLMIFSLLPG